MSAQVELYHVRKRFGGLHVLDGVTFQVTPGEVTSIIGPNGSGKSTLLNIITGVLRPDSGQVALDGEDITRLPAHERAGRGMARTFQTVRLFEEVSAVDNVMVGAHPVAHPHLARALLRPRAVQRENDELAERASSLLALAGLAGVRHRQPLGRLSMTDRRAVELARALMSEPRLLVLDEPTGGLDPRRLDEWTEVFANLRAELGLTILLVEHRMRLVMDISDHVVALHAGAILAQGSSEDVVNHPDVRRIYLGEANALG